VLKTRVITAIVITLFGLSAVFLMSPIAFAALGAAVLLALGGWEGARLAGFQGMTGRIGFAAALLVVGSTIYLGFEPDQITWYLLPGCLLWLIFMVWLTSPQLGHSDTVGWRLTKLAVIAIILLSAWLALSWLQSGSPWLVLMLLVVIAAADVGAYFSGRSIGGAKLAPRISPGKTRSGAVGGLICAMVMTALAAAVIPDSPFTPMFAGILALGLALLSIGGDLFISLLKRQHQLKDTSNLLPGHGGILDRFDSLGAALPFFALAVALWGQ
jgi:phosphatidate cytidylyltransferase